MKEDNLQNEFYKVVEKAKGYDKLLSIYGGKDGELTCSFCGKTQSEVTRLIAGPRACICDECIKLCDEILVDVEREKTDDKSN